jgi:hypothetical protein
VHLHRLAIFRNTCIVKDFVILRTCKFFEIGNLELGIEKITINNMQQQYPYVTVIAEKKFLIR